MGSDAFIFLVIVIVSFQLQHPINESRHTNNNENPRYDICQPPIGEFQ